MMKFENKEGKSGIDENDCNDQSDIQKGHRTKKKHGTH